MPAERSKLLQNRWNGPLQMKDPMYENTISEYFQVCNTNTPDVAIKDTVRKELQMKTSTTTCPSSTVYFPVTSQERDIFRTKAGKVSSLIMPHLDAKTSCPEQPLTPHQWAVYDFAVTIPKGKVTTYKDVAVSAGGSPRSGALVINVPIIMLLTAVFSWKCAEKQPVQPICSMSPGHRFEPFRWRFFRRMGKRSQNRDSIQ